MDYCGQHPVADQASDENGRQGQSNSCVFFSRVNFIPTQMWMTCKYFIASWIFIPILCVYIQGDIVTVVTRAKANDF